MSVTDALRIVAITDTHGRILEASTLLGAERVHRQLRPRLEVDYVRHMERVFRDGARMCVAVRDGTVVGVAVYRIYENTCDGVHMYVDDLVTDETARSSGVGRALLTHLQDVARANLAQLFTLDSGTQRTRAHGFYLREGLFIRGFHFAKSLA